jgi:adenylosuccinate synthase
VYQIGVMRCYAVRHGPGPLPTETDVLSPVVSEHNQSNAWQGPVRYGWFDAVLARYALEVNGKVDALCVTHLDVLSRLQAWKYCPGYQGPLDFDRPLTVSNNPQGMPTDIHLPHFLTLEQRAQFTRALGAVTPLLEACEPDGGKVLEKIEGLVGQPVGMFSSGPRAENVKILKSHFPE